MSAPVPDAPVISLEYPAMSELAQLRQWVCWRYHWDGKKWTKKPIQANGIGASSTNAHTWGDLGEVCQAAVTEGYGVGFVFAGGLVGVDLDNCRNSRTGQVESWAEEALQKLDSYTELSPSGRGFHVICRAKLPKDGAKTGNVEVYTRGRYFTVTGSHLAGRPEDIREIQGGIDWLWTTYIREQGHRAEEDATAIVASSIPLAKFHAALTNDPKFRQTWERARRDLKDQSLSSYDMALACRAAMALWAEEEIAGLVIEFRKSQGGGEKADRPDYIARTVHKAMKWAEGGRDDRSLIEHETAQRIIDEELDVRAEAREDHDRAREAVRERLRISVERFIQVGRDPAMYFLVAEGREIRLGNESQLLNQPFIRSRLLSEAAIILPTLKQFQWDTVVQCLLAIREMREAPEIDMMGRVISMLQGYLMAKPPLMLDELDDTADKGSIILERVPFIKDGKLHLSAAHVLRALIKHPDFKNSPEVRSTLAMLGFESQTIHQRHRRLKKVVGRSYMVGDMRRIVPTLELTEESHDQEAPF